MKIEKHIKLFGLLAATAIAFGSFAACGRGDASKVTASAAPRITVSQSLADAVATGGNYEAKDFSSVPDDWELIGGNGNSLGKCDVNNTRTTFFDGEMAVYHSGATGNAANYYGSAYRIATDKTYGDFTFEMTFRMVSWVNTSRFIAVMFHTEEVDNRLIGYMVNYRVNGQNAVSDLNKTAANDTGAKTAKDISDKALHTMRIELEGTACKYYLDDVLLQDWDISTKDEHLGGAINGGGFALLVNRSQIAISSVKITDPSENVPTPTQSIDDNIIASTYYENNGIVNGPTVVCDVTDEDVFGRAVTAAARPSSVILRYNADGNAVGADGDVIDSFDNAYSAIRGRIVPIVRVESEASADKFIDYMTNDRNILDISVMSSDPLLVKRVRTACPKVRGIIEYDSIDTLAALVGEVHENLATVAALPQKLATVNNVTYIQARFETVWVMPNSDLSADIYDSINSGAYGIVSPYFRDVYDMLATYDEGSITRTSMNVAHRGCSNLTYENSLSAVRLAVANGATHLELDGKLTTDGRIVIMHDDELAATTTGTGNIENKSLSQLMQYNLTVRDTGSNRDVYLKDGNGNNIIEKIPTLEQVLDEIKGTDVVLVFEIKTDKTAIVDKLKTVLEQYDMMSQVVAISFNDNGIMFDKMQSVLPQMPVARLEGLGGAPLSVNEFDRILTILGDNNAALDKSYSHGGGSLALNRYLRDRGMVGWYWTFADEAAVRVGESLGYLGITNNCAEIYKSRERFVNGKAAQTAEALAVGDTVTTVVTDYTGKTAARDGEVVYCRRTKNGWTVIAKVMTDRGYMYTQSFEIIKKT